MRSSLFVSCAAIALALLGETGAIAASGSDQLFKVGESNPHQNLEALAPAEAALATAKQCAVGSSHDTAASVEIGEYTLQAQFQCTGSTESEFLPQNCANGSCIEKCCGEEACSSQPTIAKQLSIKSGSIKNDTQTYTISLDEMPKDRNKKMFYACKKGDRKCVVTVTMPQTPPKENECAPDKTVTLAVSNPGDKVNFVCKSGTLSPTTPSTKVREYKEQACAGDEVNLQQILPGASVTASEAPDGNVELTVPTLPEKQVQLCYVCNYQREGGNPLKASTVIVTVTARSATTTSTNSTPTTTTSTAAAAHATGVGALALVALARLVF
ncbi:sag-related sequence [Cystoisospora suis]|uniref:Sag-related sequence n=1 Tax=Cystoisospora suis TaxID=483139 RepID=A0A2C6KKP1_9APIC|nr:sag-related sequence [Cystoisospora suis]